MSPHANKPEIAWPNLDESYVDAFGPIDVAVYDVARNIWPAVIPSILGTLRDMHAGQTIMMKAVALVSRKLGEDPQRITSVHGYLYRTFMRLLREEAETEGKHAELNRTMLVGAEANTKQSDSAVYEVILIHQILDRADAWTREVFQLRLLGHTYEEIAAHFGMKSNHVRSEASKELRRLVKVIAAETRAYERKVSRRKSRDDAELVTNKESEIQF